MILILKKGHRLANNLEDSHSMYSSSLKLPSFSKTKITWNNHKILDLGITTKLTFIWKHECKTKIKYKIQKIQMFILDLKLYIPALFFFMVHQYLFIIKAHLY